jgi:hypothetical protein
VTVTELTRVVRDSTPAPPAFYDPGSFWSGDGLKLTPGFSLGKEIAVEL